MASRDAVLAELKNIKDPVSGSDIVAAGIVRALNVEDGQVRFVLEIDPARAEAIVADVERKPPPSATHQLPPCEAATERM